MKRIELIRAIWDTGAETPANGLTSDQVWKFKEKTSSKYIHCLVWKHDGVEHQCSYPAVVLQDGSGLVAEADVVPGSMPKMDPRRLTVINADGTYRCDVVPPYIDAHSDLAHAWLRTPEDFRHLGIEFGVPTFDGWRLLVMEIDWATGQLKRWVLAPSIVR